MEGKRDREFNPVKNKSGADAADASRAAMIRIAHEWLLSAGCVLPDGLNEEISPLQALDADELKQKLEVGALRLADLIPRL